MANQSKVKKAINLLLNQGYTLTAPKGTKR